MFNIVDNSNKLLFVVHCEWINVSTYVNIPCSRYYAAT